MYQKNFLRTTSLLNDLEYYIVMLSRNLSVNAAKSVQGTQLQKNIKNILD